MKHTKLPLTLPWIASKSNFCVRIPNGPIVFEASEHGNTWSNDQDLEHLAYAAHACNQYPALVEALKKVDSLVDKAKRTHSWGDLQQVSDVTKATLEACGEGE